MTIVVVSKDLIVTDSYATIKEDSRSYVEGGYVKAMSIPCRFRLDDGTKTYSRLAFAGDARNFIRLARVIKDAYPVGRVVPVKELTDISTSMGGDLQLIVPFDGGVVTATYQVGRSPELEVHQGDLLAFGGIYKDMLLLGWRESYAVSWRDYLVNAYRMALIPGKEYYYLPHGDDGSHVSPTKATF